MRYTGQDREDDAQGGQTSHSKRPLHLYKVIQDARKSVKNIDKKKLLKMVTKTGGSTLKRMLVMKVFTFLVLL